MSFSKLGIAEIRDRDLHNNGSRETARSRSGYILGATLGTLVGMSMYVGVSVMDEAIELGRAPFENLRRIDTCIDYNSSLSANGDPILAVDVFDATSLCLSLFYEAQTHLYPDEIYARSVGRLTDSTVQLVISDS